MPDQTLAEAVQHLVEEVTELAVISGAGVSLEQMVETLRWSWGKAQRSPQTLDGLAGEIADVEIALAGVSGKLGIDIQEAVDDKMLINRANTKIIRAKVAAKPRIS